MGQILVYKLRCYWCYQLLKIDNIFPNCLYIDMAFSAHSQELLIHHSQKNLCLPETNQASAGLSRWRQTICQLKVKQNKQLHHPKFSPVVVWSPDHAPLSSSTVPPGIFEMDTSVLLFMKKHNSAFPSEATANVPWGMAAVLTIYWRKNWLQHPSVMINFLPENVMTGFFSSLSWHLHVKPLL